jgi:hypothetical protein
MIGSFHKEMDMLARSLANHLERSVIALLLIAVLATWASSSGEQPANELPHRVPIAILDVAKVFKQAKQFNAEMSRMKVAIEAFDQNVRNRMNGTESPEEIQKDVASQKKLFLDEEAKAYAQTYGQIERKLSEICRARDIGIVIRHTSDPLNPSDRSSVLQAVSRCLLERS